MGITWRQVDGRIRYRDIAVVRQTHSPEASSHPSTMYVELRSVRRYIQSSAAHFTGRFCRLLEIVLYHMDYHDDPRGHRYANPTEVRTSWLGRVARRSRRAGKKFP